MNLNILNTENQEFINSNLDSDIHSLLLSKTNFNSVNIKELVEQIEAKNKCRTKLPTWYSSNNIYYPNKLNIEQTSSEIAAKYKSSLIYGNSLIDLTGGFGVDSLCFAKHFNKVTHCEIDENISLIAKHNFNVLGLSNINTISDSGISVLQNSEVQYDYIYIDPSRRHDSKGKVFFLSDCLPDVTKHLGLFLERSKNILIKASPMLDISIALSELQFVKEIHIVAVDNDVKELLFLLETDFRDDINIKAVNIIDNNSQTFEFKISEEKNSESSYSLPKNYLYEPNSAIMKAGAFNTVSRILLVDKLHKHSHLYTSKNYIEFPGRRFKILEILPYSKKIISKKFSKTKANITTRNFPESVSQIRTRFSIKDGGEQFLFFTTNLNNDKIVIITNQIRK